jgi:hypothetical protein
MRLFSHAVSADMRPTVWVSGVVTGCALVFFVALSSWAEKADVKYDFSGYSCFQAGEIVKGNYEGTGQPDTLHKRWQERLLGGFNLSATVNERLNISFNPECEITHAVYDGNQNFSNDLESNHAFYFFYLNQMAGTYSFGNLENPFMQICVGYFPFTYNHEVKSLGEYLFRGTAYPGYIINDFASIYKRLAGLHVYCEPVTHLKLDFLLTTELQGPVGDFTPSLLGSYALGGQENHPLLEVGGGVSFARLLPVDPRLTTPHVSRNISEITNADTTTDGSGNQIITGDTVFYSFAATKLMARFSFDPKRFFGGIGFFGEEDFKLYGEACILGTKNYKGLYENVWRRTPMMLGFNFPACKVFDVLSFEVERYNDKYSNNFSNAYVGQPWLLPIPVISPTEPAPHPWYWAVHAERTVTQGIKLLGEATRNHYFTQTKYSNYQDRCESTPSKGDWEYIFRVQFSF